MAVHTEIMRQYRDLVRNIKSFSNGQAAIGSAPPGSDDNEDSLTILYIDISPNDGPYKDGTFKFKFDLSDDYPNGPPKINCLTKVYHPNIDQVDDYSEGDICLNLMDELWAPELTLDDFVQGLLFMFYNPNVEDPLNPAFLGSEKPEEVEENIRKSMKGEEVDGIVYDKVISDDDTQEDTEPESSSPNDTESTPADTESTPADTESTPADTESTPADTESTTTDTESTATDTESDTEADIKPDVDYTTARDEATGQHENALVESTLKDVTPVLQILPRIFIPPASVRELMKDMVQYSLAYVVVRASVYAGLYLLNKPIAR